MKTRYTPIAWAIALCALLVLPLQASSTLHFTKGDTHAIKALKALNQSVAQPSAQPETQERGMQSLHESSLLFIENKGQIVDDAGNLHPEILFKAQGHGTQIYVTATSIQYVFTHMGQAENAIDSTDLNNNYGHAGNSSVSTQKFTVSLQGANANPTLIKDKAQTFEEHYYLAHCPKGLVAHSYEKFTLKNVYPGVDWVVYSNGQGFKYDFVAVNPAAANQIKLKVDGASTKINNKGALVMETQLGSITEDQPVSFQNGGVVKTSFTQLGDGVYGFTLKGASAHAAVTIDPAVSWSTYYGGSNWDQATSCSVDASGNVFMAGNTLSTNFPLANAFQSNNAGSTDGFLVMLDNNGNRQWATYYGGTLGDTVTSCAVDRAGNVFMTGYTASTDFPFVNAFQPSAVGAGDAFLVKFDGSGSRMWATYYGGTLADHATSCAVDTSGNVFLAGYTLSANFSTSGGFQLTQGGDVDAFIAKFDSTGDRLWATYYGGTNADMAMACAVDGMGNLVVGGTTSSSNFPLANAFQSNIVGSQDAFLLKFNGNGSRMWATYYGGTLADHATACAVDTAGNVFLAGYTLSSSLATSTAFQSTNAGDHDAFLAKFSATGNREWATYYGGTNNDEVHACAVDVSGNVYIAGHTESSNIPLANAVQSNNAGSSDAFIVKFDNNGGREYATYYGGAMMDHAYGCAVDTAGNVFMAGYTASTSLAMVNAFQTTYGGGVSDAFLMKVNNDATTSNQTIKAANNRLFNLYPNPARNEVNINSAETIMNARLITITGQLVKAPFANNRISLANVAAGVYMVEVQTAAGVSKQKLIVE